jgi:hypothetical protein
MRALTGNNIVPAPIYLPASRAGFLLAYKTLAGTSIGRTFGMASPEEEYGNTRLAAPAVDFLKMLSTMDTNSGVLDKRAETVSFIEKRILDGKIASSTMPIPDYYYQPNRLSDLLQMHVSSGVVAEVTPLLLVLQKKMANSLFIEEPETCLHSKLQIEMARALIRTANAHFPLITSTHSDIILQHVNNMIRLKLRPDRDTLMKRFGYDENDLIDAEAVSVYEFNEQNGRTEITKIERGEDSAFQAPTFVESLEKILHETMDIASEDAVS